MFSLIQKLSKLYAAVLIGLLAIVIFFSITLVSMIHSHNDYSETVYSLSLQTYFTQQTIINIKALRDVKDISAHKQEIFALRHSATNLKAEFAKLKDLLETANKHETGNIHSYLFHHHKKSNLHTILTKEWSGQNIMTFMQNVIKLSDQILSKLKMQIANKHEIDLLSIEAYSDLQKLLNGIGNKRFVLVSQAVEEIFHEKMQSHKNALLVCIILFIALIAFEALLIYRPFTKRVHEKIAAIEKEQDIITATRQNIQEDQARIQLAMQGQAIGIFDWDIQNDTLYLSEYAQKLLSVKDKASADGSDPTLAFNDCMTMEQMISEFKLEEQEKLRRAIEDHLKHQKHLKLTLKHTQGISGIKEIEEISLSFKGQSIWNEMGVATRLVGTLRDITSDQHERELRQMFTLGIEESPLAMSIIDVTKFGRGFLYTSPGFSNLFGYDRDLLLKSNLYMLNGPDTKMEHIDELEAIFDSEQPAEIEIIHYRSNGEPFLNHISLTPIKTKDNDINAYILFHDDMSEAQQQNNLEIDRQRLEAIGNLTQQMSLEVTQSCKDTEQINNFTEEQSKYLLHKIYNFHSNILGFFSKKNQDRKSLNIIEETTSICDMAESLYSNDLLISIDNQTGDASKIGYLNQAEFRQLLLNIIENATIAYRDENIINDNIKNLTEQKIDIKIEAPSLSIIDAKKIGLPEKSQNYIMITIADQGCGIHADNIEIIFNPTTSLWKNENRYGMGLTVARGLTRSWGGEIMINSAEHNGTNVIIYIPVFPEDEDEEFLEMAHLLDELNDNEL